MSASDEDLRKFRMKRKQVTSEEKMWMGDPLNDRVNSDPQLLQQLEDVHPPVDSWTEDLGDLEEPELTPLQVEMQEKAHLCLYWIWGELGRDTPANEVENLACDLMDLPTDELRQLVRIFYPEARDSL